MKKLFTTQGRFIITANEKEKKIRLWNLDTEQSTVIDYDGNPLNCPFYEDTDSENNDCIYTDDPAQFEGSSEGFYAYTTKEYTLDPDGAYGSFGIKRVTGEKLTEEIYYKVNYFSNGLCAVCNEDGKWGCINTNGELVIPFQFSDAPVFNRYGVACGDDCLIDMQGKPIEGTKLNFIGGNDYYQRFFATALWSEEICQMIDQCGHADGAAVDYYDTKNREYILRNMDETRIEIECCNAEKEVIVKAASLLTEYDKVEVEESGVIIAKKGDCITIFDCYGE